MLISILTRFKDSTCRAGPARPATYSRGELSFRIHTCELINLCLLYNSTGLYQLPDQDDSLIHFMDLDCGTFVIQIILFFVLSYVSWVLRRETDLEVSNLIDLSIILNCSRVV